MWLFASRQGPQWVPFFAALFRCGCSCVTDALLSLLHTHRERSMHCLRLIATAHICSSSFVTPTFCHSSGQNRLFLFVSVSVCSVTQLMQAAHHHHHHIFFRPVSSQFFHYIVCFCQTRICSACTPARRYNVYGAYMPQLSSFSRAWTANLLNTCALPLLQPVHL